MKPFSTSPEETPSLQSRGFWIWSSPPPLSCGPPLSTIRSVAMPTTTSSLPALSRPTPTSSSPATGTSIPFRPRSVSLSFPHADSLPNTSRGAPNPQMKPTAPSGTPVAGLRPPARPVQGRRMRNSTAPAAVAPVRPPPRVTRDRVQSRCSVVLPRSGRGGEGGRIQGTGSVTGAVTVSVTVSVSRGSRGMGRCGGVSPFLRPTHFQTPCPIPRSRPGRIMVPLETRAGARGSRFASSFFLGVRVDRDRAERRTAKT